MADPYPQQCTQWLQWYNRQYGVPQKDPSAVPRLTRAIADYLQMKPAILVVTLIFYFSPNFS